MSPMARRVPSPGPSAPLALRLPVRASAPPRKRNKRRRQAPASPRHARTRERGLLSWGPGPLLGRGQASAILARQRSSSGTGLSSHQKNVTSTFWPFSAGQGRPGQAGGWCRRTKASVWRAAAQSPRPDLSCESPDRPAPRPGERGDGTLKKPQKERSPGTSASRSHGRLAALKAAGRRAHTQPTPTPQGGC